MIVAASKVAKAFSSDRMLSEYLEQCYVPGAFHRRAMKGVDREPLKRLVAWKERVRNAWPGIRFEAVTIEPDPATLPPAAAFEVEARVALGPIERQLLVPETPVGSDRDREDLAHVVQVELE